MLLGTLSANLLGNLWTDKETSRAGEVTITLREDFPNTELFLVRIFRHLD